MASRLIIIVALYLCYKGIKYLIFSNKSPQKKTPNDSIDSMVECKECGLYVPGNEALKKKIGEETHYFCSDECHKKYTERV